MLTLYQFGPAWDMPDPSPFVLKTMVYLELAGIPYQPASGMKHLRNAPKGKLPYLRDGDTVVCDSSFIQDYLLERYGEKLPVELSAEQRGALRGLTRMLDEDLYFVLDYLLERYGEKLPVELSAEQRGALRGLTRMLDEDFYFVLVYLRWLDERAWQNYTKPNFFSNLPWPLSSLVPWVIRRGVQKSLHGQGIARHTKEEIVEIGRRDLQAVADYLGDKAFIAGDQPCAADTTVFAFLASFADAPHPSPLREWVTGHEKVISYLKRMKARLPNLYPQTH